MTDIKKKEADKSEDEIKFINMKKSTGRMNQLFNNDPKIKNIPGILYYIKFYNDDISFWKIGITSKTIKERFGTKKKLLSKHRLKYEILWEDTHMSFYDCFKKEQEILSKNKKDRILINYNNFTTTEAFSKDIWLNS